MNKKEQSRQTFDLQASKYDTTFYGKHARKIYPYLLNEIIRCYALKRPRMYYWFLMKRWK